MAALHRALAQLAKEARLHELKGLDGEDEEDGMMPPVKGAQIEISGDPDAVTEAGKAMGLPVPELTHDLPEHMEEEHPIVAALKKHYPEIHAELSRKVAH